jgi:hypothetical protein
VAFPEHGAPSLCWTDIESAGRDPLDERTGFLLEVGFRITDADLRTVAERSWLIPYRDATLNAINGETPPDIRAMHEASGLWRDLTDKPGNPDVQSMVIADIEARRELGRQRYGTALQPHNGRDVLRDAYEEAIDLAMYLRQAIAERDNP